MTPEDYTYICQMVKARSGLALSDDKRYLVESRLQSLVRSRGCKTLSEFVQYMRSSKSEDTLREMTEAMTTNESFFFRDTKPFEQFRRLVLPALLAGEKKHLRIWSAACSSGQEAYSIAISLNEAQMQAKGISTEIIATDIAQHVLDKAKQGVYSQFEVQRGLPIQMLLKYFTQGGDNQWQVKDELRRMVQFKYHNLMGEVASLGQFDVIFCRNVLIYFDEATKSSVLGKIVRASHKPGYLYLGSAETIIGLNKDYKPIAADAGLYSIG